MYIRVHLRLSDFFWHPTSYSTIHYILDNDLNQKMSNNWTKTAIKKDTNGPTMKSFQKFLFMVDGHERMIFL